MAQLAKIETAKVPATRAAAGLQSQDSCNVIALQTDDRVYQRFGLIILLLVFGVFAVWAAVAPLGSHAVASGKVVVSAKKQIVQHREGGVISEILVKDGDQVKQGQTLLMINPTEAQAEQGITQEQLLSNSALEARLVAELEGEKSITFPAMLTDGKQPFAVDVVADEQQQFKVRRAAAEAETAVLRERIQQLREKQTGLDGQIEAQRALVASHAKELANLRSLAERQLISQMQVDTTERSMLAVKSDIAELESGKATVRVQISENEEQLVLQENNRRKQVAEQLTATRVKLADLRNRLKVTEARLQRSVVVAPMTGTVVGLEYHTLGGVVQPGSTILEIVPETDAFLIEALVAPSDIDKVHQGLEADVRFPAFGSSSSYMKVIPGVVETISADSVTDKNSNQAFYQAIIKIKPEGMAELQKQQLELVQGMPAEASIKTGDRTLLDYLLKPMTNMLTHAFNED